ncbi:hypothetical protein [Comamonas terrigena]|uniref:hypothetical protein n=1 Tax=Comamonas terrigena TaxID=32013 RepID=UPI0028A2CEDB|nr:hypothetical protein [Comamonas terrigena]
MILPPNEIINDPEHSQIKENSKISLDYQIEKVLYLINEVENGLDKQAQSLYWYIKDKTTLYNVDSLIHNLSILIEYYHAWVVFSYIGTITHKKTSYSALKNDDNLNSAIEKLFKENSIGILKITKDENNEYYEKCKKAFLHAYKFLFVGRFHEIFALNNYLKHNRIAMGYAPKVSFNDAPLTLPYLYIEKPNDRLFNASVTKRLFEHDCKNEIINDDNDYYIKIINNTKVFLCSLGAYNIYNINGVEYIKSSTQVGILMESIVEIAHELFKNIVTVVKESAPGATSDNQVLDQFLNELNKRPPKILSELIRPIP